MKFYPAYKNNRPTFKQTEPTAGAYLIRYQGQIQYVGYSATNVVKTAYRHFQQWNDPRQYRATFPKTADIHFYFTSDPSKAAKRERTWIIKYGLNKYGDLLKNTYLPAPADEEPLPF